MLPFAAKGLVRFAVVVEGLVHLLVFAENGDGVRDSQDNHRRGASTNNKPARNKVQSRDISESSWQVRPNTLTFKRTRARYHLIGRKRRNCCRLSAWVHHQPPATSSTDPRIRRNPLAPVKGLIQWGFSGAGRVALREICVAGRSGVHISKFLARACGVARWQRSCVSESGKGLKISSVFAPQVVWAEAVNNFMYRPLHHASETLRRRLAGWLRHNRSCMHASKDIKSRRLSDMVVAIACAPCNCKQTK